MESHTMIKSQRWFVVGLLFLAGVINYLDRAALSIAAPLIQKDLNFSHAQMGIVFSSFFIGYAPKRHQEILRTGLQKTAPQSQHSLPRARFTIAGVAR